jgi:hypothetical protein
MRRSRKPVRKCYSCLLNLGDHCWLYRYPRGQWRHGHRCPALGREDVYTQFREWQKEPAVRTRRDLRREFFRTKRRTELHRDTQAGAIADRERRQVRRKRKG